MPALQRFILIISLMAQYVPSALAVTQADCESIADLSDRIPSPRNQMGSNYCYAFVTADLLTYALKLPRPQAISAAQLVSIANSSFQANKATERFLGHSLSFGVDPATRTQMKEGMGVTDDAALDQALRQMFIQNLKENLALFGPGYASTGGKPSFMLAAAVSQKALCTEADLPSEPFANPPATPEYLEHPPAPADFLTPFLKEKTAELANLYPGASPADTIGSYCANSPRSVDPDKSMSVHALGLFDPSSAQEQVSLFVLSALRREWPVAVSFRSPAMLGLKSQDPNWQHIALFVGARWNPAQKRCEVKLKNSWGRTADYSCTRQKKFECKNGYYWLPLEDSVPFMTELTYVSHP